MSYTRPFLKWPGGKYRLLDHILKTLPKGNRLVEPFGGSGAVFINTDFDHYLIAESNRDLIQLFAQLQEEGERFIDYCAKFFTKEANIKNCYYERRAQFNTSQNPREKGALFLYLNRHGYNGLCRYNQSGGYNVPFGKIIRPYFPHKEMLHFYLKSQKASFVHQDYQETFSQLREGDIIYCDPPYVKLSPTASFTNYTGTQFDETAQLKLLALAKQAKLPVIISNHDTPFTREHYKGAKIKRFSVRRNISCHNREKVKEILAVF